MRFALATAALACCLALLAGAASAHAPTQIGATAHDADDSVPGMTLTLSRVKVDPGPARIELYNAGEDPHDMIVQRRGGHAQRRYDELLHGQSQEIELKLKADSRYDLWCSLKGHRSQGMDAVLRVRRK